MAVCNFCFQILKVYKIDDLVSCINQRAFQHVLVLKVSPFSEFAYLHAAAILNNRWIVIKQENG